MTALVRTRVSHESADIGGVRKTWWLRRIDGSSDKPFVDLGGSFSATRNIDIEIALVPGRYTLGAGEATERGRVRESFVVPAGFEPAACQIAECTKQVPFQPGVTGVDAGRCKDHRKSGPVRHSRTLTLDQPAPPRRSR